MSHKTHLKTRTKMLVGSLLLATGLFVACGGGGSSSTGTDNGSQSNTDNQNTLQARITDEALNKQIVPYFSAAKTQVTSLQTAINNLCSTPTAANLTTAQKAWNNAMTAWAQTQAVALRPLVSDTRNPLFIYFFPDENKLTSKNVNDLLSESFALTTGLVKGSGGAESGLSGLEYVLYGDTAKDTNSPSIAMANEFTGRRCDLAKAQVSVLADDISEYVSLWSGQYGKEFKGATGDFSGDNAAVTAWFNSLLELAEVMKNQKLGFATGYSTGTPKSVFDARFAGISKLVYETNLDVLKTALLGSDNATGIAIYLDSATTKKLVSDLTAVEAALKAMNVDSFADATPEQTRTLYDAQSALVGTIKNDVARAANFQVTFNNNDGD